MRDPVTPPQADEKTFRIGVWPITGGYVNVDIQAKDAQHALRKLRGRKAYRGALTTDAELVTDTEDTVRP